MNIKVEREKCRQISYMVQQGTWEKSHRLDHKVRRTIQLQIFKGTYFKTFIEMNKFFCAFVYALNTNLGHKQ